MPIFTAELSDGRKVRFEADEQPSEQELLAAVEQHATPFEPPVADLPAPSQQSLGNARSGMEMAAQTFNYGKPVNDNAPEFGPIFAEGMSRSMIGPDVPRVESPSNDFMPSLGAGILNTVGGAANFLRSPLGLTALAASAIPGAAPFVAGAFTADMGYHGGKGIEEGLATGNKQQAIEGALGAGMAFLPAAHAKSKAAAAEAKTTRTTTPILDTAKTSPIAAEDLAYLEAERASINAPVELVDEVTGNEPFARKIATVDRATGKVLVNKSEFSSWLKGIPEEQRAEAVRSLLSEEQIHLGVDDASALAYWEDLTAAEKAIQRRRYTGKWRGNEDITDTNYGHEAVRFRLQQLARMTPREVAEAVGLEKWTVKGITALESAVRTARETLGTEASARQIELIDQMQANLDVAKSVVGQSQPGAYNKKAQEVADDTVKALRAQAEAYRQDGDARAAAEMEQQASMIERKMQEDSFPAAIRKGRKDTSEQGFMFLPPAERGAVERPGVEASKPVTEGELALTKASPGIERERPVEIVTPQKISDFAEEHLSAGSPDFNGFVEGAQGKFGVMIQKGQLRDVWEDAVWKKLLSASGKELEQLRTELKLGRHFGNRAIGDAVEPKAPILTSELSGEARAAIREGEKRTNSGQKYRNAVVRGIATKLLSQTQEGSTSLRRSTLTPEDIAWNRPSSFNAFREISAEEAASPQMLEKLATEGFRASASKPETQTRRVLALVNKSTGEVEMVSTYLHPRSGVMVVDPKLTGRMRPNVPLSSLSKNYRPIASVLLDEPVQNFRQKFESVSQFNEQFADQARSEVQSQASYEASLEEGAGVTEGVAEAPSVIRAGEKLTDAEAGKVLDHLMDEHNGSVAGPEDVLQTISELADKPDWQVVAGYNKMFQAIRERLPELTPQQALEQMADEIYERQKTSKTRGEFVSGSLKEYGGQVPEAGQGTPQALPAKTGRPLAMRERPSPIETTHMIIKGQPKAMADSPGALRKGTPTTKSEFLKKLVADPASGFSRWYSEWMSEAVRSQGGPQAARAADVADVIVDRAKALYGKELTPTLDAAKKLAGGNRAGSLPSPSLIKANAWLDKLNHPVSKQTGIANVVDAIEGRAIVPAGAQATVAAARASNLASGRLVQPVIPGFIASNKFQRNLTPLGNDILSEGPTSKNPSDLWNIYTKHTAILNHPLLNARRVSAKKPPISIGEEIRQSRRFFLKMRDTLRETSDPNRIEKINQDFARQYPKAITHIKTASGWQEMMHTSLFNYLENVAQRAAHTLAFREQFPLTAAGKLDFAQLDAGVRGELSASSVGYWDALVKTMQGRPTDTYSTAGPLRPGQPLGELVKGLNQTAMATLRRLALTGQMVTQLPETLVGSGLAELGMANRIRSLVKLKQLWPEMEKQGQVNQLLYDWSFDPKNPVRSVFRQGNNLISKVFAENFLNEFQGRLSAAIATSAADRVRNQAAEPLTAWEKRQYPETFRKMQFTPDQVAGLMAGDPILLKAFERRAPAWLTTENRAKTETSLAGNNRLLNSVFPFQMYPMNKLNQFRRNYQRLGEAYRSGDKKQLVNAGEGMARFLLGNAAQGAAYALLAAYAFGGKEGAKIKAHESADEPFEFLAESLIATLGGPYYLIWQGARRNGVAGIGEQATRMLFPYTQYADLRDMFMSEGQYRDQDWPRRIGRYVMQKTPGLRIAKQALSVFGLAQESTPTEQAIKGFNRWKLDTYGPSNTAFDSPEDRRAFRTQMRKAIEAIKVGDADGYQEALQNAREEAPKRTSPAQSFRARKILKNNTGQPLTDEELDALSKRIGEDALERLQDYDAMLEQAAKGWTPSGLE